MFFTSEMSARRCQGWRKMLRSPLLMKFVSYGSFEGIAPPKPPAGEKRQGETIRLQCGKACGGATVTGNSVLRRAARSQRNDGIGDTVVHTVEDAADRAAVVDDTVWLAALENGESLKAQPSASLPFHEDSAKNFGSSYR